MPSSHVLRALIVACTSTLAATASAASFRYVQIDVGQGDASVVIAPGGCAALFDGGDRGDGAKIKAALKALGVQRLDFAVASHYHADHIGGIDEVEQGIDAVPIGLVYDHGGSASTVTFTQYDTQYAGRRRTAVVGQSLSLCEATVTFVASDANGMAAQDENERSVAAKVTWQKIDILVGGDLTVDVEDAIRYDVGPVEIYKIHHHGSVTSSSPLFLDVIKPVVSLLSVGIGNTYGHPVPETIDRLLARGSDVWRTQDPATSAVYGNISVESTDGTSFVVEQNGVRRAYGTVTPPPTPDPGGGGDPGDVPPDPYDPGDTVVGCATAPGALAPSALMAIAFVAPLARLRRRSPRSER